jgi:hypothetical protein
MPICQSKEIKVSIFALRNINCWLTYFSQPVRLRGLLGNLGSVGSFGHCVED